MKIFKAGLFKRTYPSDCFYGQYHIIVKKTIEKIKKATIFHFFLFFPSPVGIYLFQVNTGNTRANRRSFFKVNKNNVINDILLPLFLTLKKFQTLFLCFHCLL